MNLKTRGPQTGPRISTLTQTGLTIPELLVAMTISTLIITAAYALFRTHHRMALRQEESTLMQQELLAATTQMAEELRMCGYSPNGNGSFGFRHRPDLGTPDFGRETSARGIYCTLDLEGDGETNESGSGSAADHVGYRLNVGSSGASKNTPDNVLRKYDTGAVKWQPLCTNIGELRFVYRNRIGGIIENPELHMADIRMIEVHVTAVPSINRRHLGIANRTMSTRIWCRNMVAGDENPL